MGVDTYFEPDVFPALHACVFDAIVMYAFLTHAPYTNLLPERCHLFLSGTLFEVKEKAARAGQYLLATYGFQVREGFVDEVGRCYRPPLFASVYEAIVLTTANSKPRDLLLVYMGGHGVSVNGEHIVAMFDTRPAIVADTGLAVSKVVNVMARSRTQRRVLLLDACDRVFSGSISSTKSARAVHKYRDVALLTAAMEEDAFEVRAPEGAYGLFTRFVSDGLSGRADRRGRGYTAFGDLADYVIEAVDEWRVQHPLAARGPVVNVASRRLRSSIVLAGTAPATQSPFPATRSEECERLYRWWDEGATRILLHGEPGAGKSWIAHAFAQDGPFDGVVEHDFSTGGTDADVLWRLDEQVRGMRDRAQDQHVLLLLDNLAEPHLLRDIEAGLVARGLPGRVRVTVLVTSTTSTLEFSRARNVRRLRVGPFGEAEAQAVLRGRVQPDIWKRFGPQTMAVAARFEFVPAVVDELGEWLEQDQGGWERVRTRVVPSRVSKSFQHVNIVLESLTPPERRLVEAMAVCASRGFPLSLAERLAGDPEDQPRVAEALAARSLLRVVDRERQLFRLPPLVRAAVRRQCNLDRLRQRHADLVRALLDEGVPSLSNRKADLAVARGALLEVPVAARWLRRQKEFAAMSALLESARAVLETPSPAERHFEIRLRRQRKESRRVGPRFAPAAGVYERVLWRDVLSRQADGAAASIYRLLQELVDLHKSQNDGWREQACLALLAQLELGLDDEARVAQARDWLKRREEVCRNGRHWEDLASCLGDQIVLRFTADSPDIGRAFERHALTDVVPLFEAQSKVARLRRRHGHLPSEQGNLAAFHLAVKAFDAGLIELPIIPDAAFHLDTRESPLTRLTGLLLMVFAMLGFPHVRRGASSPWTDAAVSTTNPDTAVRWPRRAGHRQPDVAPPDPASASWREHRITAEVPVNDVPGQHTRFWSVYRRLMREWARAMPADAEAARQDAMRRYYSSGDVADLETVIAILDAAGRYDYALDLLRSHAESAQAMKDDVAWLGALVRHADLASSAIEALDRAPTEGHSATNDGRLAEWVKQRPLLTAEADALTMDVTFRALLAYHLWCWGLLAACMGDREGATTTLRQTHGLFEDLGLTREARFVESDGKRLGSLVRFGRALLSNE